MYRDALHISASFNFASSALVGSIEAGGSRILLQIEFYQFGSARSLPFVIHFVVAKTFYITKILLKTM